ncbi:MAG: hypothetical protein ACK57Z_04230 [Akkermansiaceae bacterium]
MKEKSKSRILPWLLVILPLWLIVSAAVFLVQYFKNEASDKSLAEQRFAKSVSAESIADDLRKIISVIGERNTSKPDQLSATASMIEGSLGPSNIGYQIEKITGSLNFPILKVTIPSSGPSAEPIWILTSYDSPKNSRGAEKNASGLVATLATAQALADFSTPRPIHFLFIPHANEDNSPILETVTIISNLIKPNKPKAILCVEAMSDAETLTLSSRDTTLLPSVDYEDLGKIVGAEVICLGEDFDLASTLVEMGHPTIRISTRPMLLPDEADNKLPFAPTLAASTGRFIELVRRLSKLNSP